eukprot:TRINITY_DN1750_c0_g1_i1.p2 TRINITY_DN1750_c0_g1~~TRINITY_DN1750_c0_g1_i1.p2  ORF type:complete len:239 (-),score=66.65 TRINITY_DN1750_c0_g1_i1:230-946(-)
MLRTRSVLCAVRRVAALRAAASPAALPSGLARLAPVVPPTSVPARFSSFPTHLQLAKLFTRELEQEAGKGKLPTPPTGWTLDNRPGKIQLKLTRASGETTIYFTMQEHSEGAEGSTDAPDKRTDFIVLIDKPNNGTVAIKCTTDPDYLFFINSVSHYKDSKIAHGETADDDWSRDESYEGPTVAELEEDIQSAFHALVQEHGVDEDLTTFIIETAHLKEQSEYERWLCSMDKFMSAPF